MMVLMIFSAIYIFPYEVKDLFESFLALNSAES